MYVFRLALVTRDCKFGTILIAFKIYMGHYQKMEKFRKAKSKKYEKNSESNISGFIDTGMGNNIESLRCFTRAITHQGLVLLHATHAKMSVQSQINFFHQTVC